MNGRTAGRLLAMSLAFFSAPASAQDAPTPAANSDGISVADTVTFLAGSAAALGLHEAGHLVFDAAFGADVEIKRVTFGPFPFFAIAHGELSPKREFAVSSVGLWIQAGTNEWLLTARPDLRREHAPFAKGMFAFNVLTSIGYGAVAMARAGPYERDTRGIADASGVDERAIGALVMAPAILDAYRYVKPGSRWAVWASRAAKVGSVLLIFK